MKTETGTFFMCMISIRSTGKKVFEYQIFQSNKFYSNTLRGPDRIKHSHLPDAAVRRHDSSAVTRNLAIQSNPSVFVNLPEKKKNSTFS